MPNVRVSISGKSTPPKFETVKKTVMQAITIRLMLHASLYFFTSNASRQVDYSEKHFT